MTVLELTKPEAPHQTGLGKIQAYLQELDDLYFVCMTTNKKHPDFSKLDVNSFSYDRTYERKTRRKELNLIYLLDEICLSNHPEDSSSLDILNEIEDLMYSPVFYRQLIGCHFSQTITDRLNDLIFSVKEKIERLNDNITEPDYQSCLSDLVFLKAPPTRTAFTKQLNTLQDFLTEKRDRLACY